MFVRCITKMRRFISGFLLAVVIFTISVTGWSNGASTVSCRSLYPIHGTTPQNYPSPYFLSTNKDTLFTNDSVTVTLSGSWFKGFLIVAKPTGNWQMRSQKPIGIFRNNFGLKVFDCLEEINNAVSQSSSQYNDDVEVEWTPHPDFQGRVTFIATIVKNFKMFWTFVHSKPVKVFKLK